LKRGEGAYYSPKAFPIVSVPKNLLGPVVVCLNMIYNENGRHGRPKKWSGGSTDMGGVTEVKLLTKPFWGMKYSSK